MLIINDMKTYNDRKKKKAFLGALIGAGISLVGNAVGGAISAKKQKAAQKQELANQRAIAELQKSAQKEQAGIQTAQNLTNYYADSYNREQEFMNRFKQYKCGGRKKAKWGTNDTVSTINVVGDAASGIIGSIMQPKQQNTSSIVALENPELIYGQKVGNFSPTKQQNTAVYAGEVTANNQPFSSIQYLTKMNKSFRCGGRKRR